MSGILKEKFLLYRIRAKKDPEAFAEVYDSFVKPIYRFIYFKAWQYLKEKREVPYLQALLYSIARSVVVDFYRSTACEREDVSLDDERLTDVAAVAGEKLLKEVDAKFDLTRAIEALRGLKDEYREVVVMRYMDDLSIKEIAAALGKTPTNVRVLLHRATRALAETVNNEASKSRH
jgi:RNA polymerase sigma-70 factor (ECF subfamily)